MDKSGAYITIRATEAKRTDTEYVIKNIGSSSEGSPPPPPPPPAYPQCAPRKPTFSESSTEALLSTSWSPRRVSL